MIILAGWIRIEQGARATSVEPMRAMEAATRSEPGCLEYSIAFDHQDDHQLRIFEAYEDADSLAAHRESPHLAAWRNHIGGKVIERRMSQYEVSSAQEI